MKLTIENLTININACRPELPPIRIHGSLYSGGATRPNKLPSIGDKWPGTEAIYAGKALSRDGSKIIDLIYWPDASHAKRNYADNISYCESVDANTGSHAATRQQAIVINDNLRQLMSTDHAYWTETRDNTSKYAFVQGFTSGYQYYDTLSHKLRALAVSEIH